MHAGTSPSDPRALASFLSYDPDRLADALQSKWPQVYGRALHVSATLGAFITRVLGDAATGALERNTPKRAKELRNLLSSLG